MWLAWPDKGAIRGGDDAFGRPRPHPRNAGGLNGSLQHLPETFLYGVYWPKFVHRHQFKQNKSPG